LSSHPDPGNRTEYITKEAESLTIATPSPDMTQFPTIKERFALQPKAKSVAELSERGASSAVESPNAPNAPSSAGSTGTPGQPIPAPSSQFRTFSAGNLFQASVPANWTTIPSKSEVKVVPENGYGELNGQTVFTHGVEFGIAKASSRDLQEATKSFLLAIAQNNPQLRLAGDQQYGKMADRSALLTPLTNPSSLGGNERITIATTFLVDGNLFYYLTVAPEADADALLPVFKKIGQSIRLTDVK